MNINKKIKIIGFCKKYIEKNKKDTLIDPNIYFCSFADTLGYFFLKYKCYEDIPNLIRKWLYKILNIIYALKTNEFQIKPDHRPYTKYEKRGLNLGHNVWDIVFMRI